MGATRELSDDAFGRVLGARRGAPGADVERLARLIARAEHDGDFGPALRTLAAEGGLEREGFGALYERMLDTLMARTRALWGPVYRSALDDARPFKLARSPLAEITLDQLAADARPPLRELLGDELTGASASQLTGELAGEVAESAWAVAFDAGIGARLYAVRHELIANLLTPESITDLQRLAVRRGWTSPLGDLIADYAWGQVVFDWRPCAPDVPGEAARRRQMFCDGELSPAAALERMLREALAEAKLERSRAAFAISC